jgi:hypothetical protein
MCVNKAPDDTGGDFYDWDSMPDGRLIVVLGDVTGYGIGPALLAAACRAYARSSFGASQNLPAALTQINAVIARDLDPSRFKRKMSPFFNCIFVGGPEIYSGRIPSGTPCDSISMKALLYSASQSCLQGITATSRAQITFL